MKKEVTKLLYNLIDLHTIVSILLNELSKTYSGENRLIKGTHKIS